MEDGNILAKCHLCPKPERFKVTQRKGAADETMEFKMQKAHAHMSRHPSFQTEEDAAKMDVPAGTGGARVDAAKLARGALPRRERDAAPRRALRQDGRRRRAASELRPLQEPVLGRVLLRVQHRAYCPAGAAKSVGCA